VVGSWESHPRRREVVSIELQLVFHRVIVIKRVKPDPSSVWLPVSPCDSSLMHVHLPLWRHPPRSPHHLSVMTLICPQI
jgi:hypothetical protein